jgi:type II secretory pathway pseudopilin PulG
MRRSSESGFTLVEVLISAAVLLPILLAVISAKEVVSNSIATNERRADTADQVRKVARRLRQIIRAGLFSTIKFRATQADIDEAEAKEAERIAENPLGTPIYIPTLGEWISVAELQPRSNLRFQAAAGTLAINAGARTPPRSLLRPDGECRAPHVLLRRRGGGPRSAGRPSGQVWQDPPGLHPAEDLPAEQLS